MVTHRNRCEIWRKSTNNHQLFKRKKSVSFRFFGVDERRVSGSRYQLNYFEKENHIVSESRAMYKRKETREEILNQFGKILDNYI